MSNANKLPKERTSTANRIAPRQTAASAARAAKHATNRNLANPIPPKSLPRVPSATAATKARSPIRPRKSESKPDVKFDLFESTITSSVDKLALLAKAASPVKDKFLITDDQTIGKDQNESVQQSEDGLVSDVGQLKKPRGKSQPPSRPQTPRVSTRLSTSAHPGQRPPTPGSRPTTPHKPPHNQTSKAVKDSPPNEQTQSVTKKTPVISGDDIQKVFNQKQQEFHLLKKELDIKQHLVLSAFESLRALQEAMSRDGFAEEFCVPEDLVVFNVANWTRDEVAQLCRDVNAAACSDGARDTVDCCEPIDQGTFMELDAKLKNGSSNLAEICLQASTARQELLDWIKELISTQEDENGEYVQKISHHNNLGLDLLKNLREVKDSSEEDIYTFTKLSKRALHDREALISVAQTLLRDVATLRQSLDKQMNINNEMRDAQPVTDSSKKIDELTQELEEEKAAHSALRDKYSTTESQLRQTRIRINKMDRQLMEAEASISTLTGTIKSLEDQSRQKEVQLESRARKLRDSLKSGEAASNQLVQQRDALHAEIKSLTERIEEMTSEHNNKVQEMIDSQKKLKSALDEQKNENAAELDQKVALEAKLAENENTVQELQNRIVELEKCIPNPDLPTEREIEIWSELQATKDTLSITEEEVASCKREKVRFLENLSKISEHEDKVGLQQKLAAELLSKEELIGKMQIQLREVTKNLKFNEQKVMQYEQFVHDLQAHNAAVGNVMETPEGVNYQDLQQELVNLRLGLLDAVHRNDELSEILAQKEQILENQDRTSRAQARVIKVREELINMLKNKETEQSHAMAALQQDLEQRMRVVDDVNKQIAAKAGEIQALFSTLENKQQQIHRLEKIVLALEEQQRRAQVQRTRHEEKIATLEHELVGTGKGKGEKRFLFF